MKYASSIGYNIGRASNGISLPRTIEESYFVSEAAHTGGHIKSYYDFVRNKLEPLNAAYKAMNDGQIFEELRRIEREIDAALEGGSQALQRKGWPNPK